MRRSMKGSGRSTAVFATVLALGALVAGCTSVPGLPGLGGSASMRIEVEVYKGPLSQEPDVQWGELRGLVGDTPRLLGLLDDALLVTAFSEGHLPEKANATFEAATGFVGEFQKFPGSLDILDAGAREAHDSLKTADRILKVKAPKTFDLARVLGVARNLKDLHAKHTKLAAALRSKIVAARTKWVNKTGLTADEDRFLAQVNSFLPNATITMALTAYEAELTVVDANHVELDEAIRALDASNLQTAVPHCINSQCGAEISDAVNAIEVMNVTRSLTSAATEPLYESVEKILIAFDGKTPSKPVNVKPRQRLVNPPAITTSRVPVRGVVWGRFGQPLRDDDAAWCSGKTDFTNANLELLQLGDMECVINAQLHADTIRFMRWAEAVSGELDVADGRLKSLALDCDPSNDTTTGTATGTTQTVAPSDACKDLIAAFRSKARGAVSDVAALAVAMKASAFYWAQAQIPVLPNSNTIATFSQSYAVITAELSNQMQSRADALEKQFTHHRSVQPTSVYLRNTDPTDFANLYIWSRPLLGLAHDAITNGSAESRLIGVERLYGDHNWSKINTVHANGQGEVAMAFVKDDIGNWDLKSFQNDPTELLDAYVDVGKALIKTATVAAGGGGLGAVTSALGLGGPIEEEDLKAIESNAAVGHRMAFGGGANNTMPGGAAAAMIDDLRDKTLLELERLKPKVDAAQAEIADVKKAAAAKPASGSVAFERLPESGDTLTINGEPFEFARDEVAANERASKVYRGKTRTDAVDNLVAALTKVAETRPAITEVTYARAGEGTLKLTAVTAGAKGNEIALTASRNAEWNVTKLTPPKSTDTNKPAAILTFDRVPVIGDSVTIDGVRFMFAATDDDAKRLVGIVPGKIVETVTALRTMVTTFTATPPANGRYTVEQPGTPAIPATLGTPAIPATAGTPAVPATPGTPAIPATPAPGPSLKIIAVASNTARETISLAASRNTVVTKMSGGADKTEPDIDATGLTALKKDADRILREYQIRIETLQKLSVPPKAS